MICQQQTVAEDAPCNENNSSLLAGLLSFYFFAVAAVVTASAAAWAVIAVHHLDSHYPLFLCGGNNGFGGFGRGR